MQFVQSSREHKLFGEFEKKKKLSACSDLNSGTIFVCVRPYFEMRFNACSCSPRMCLMADK